MSSTRTPYAELVSLSKHEFEKRESLKEKDKFVSVMSYEDAILSAIVDLKDNFSVGSSVTAIAKHIQANFVDVNHPHLGDYIKFVPPFHFRNSLFLQALKSIVDKGCVNKSSCTSRNGNGSTLYSLSSKYKKQRAQEINERLKMLELYKEKAQQREKKLAKTRKEAPVRKALHVKAHLVDTKAFAIVPNEKHIMDLDSSSIQNIPSSLPIQLNIRKELRALKKKKCFRGNMKIQPHKNMLVKLNMEGRRDNMQLW